MKKEFFQLLSLVLLILISVSCKKSSTEAPAITVPVITTTVASNITSSSIQTGGIVTSDGGNQVYNECPFIRNPEILFKIITTGLATN